MKYICSRSCFDNSRCEGYRMDNEYDLTPYQLEHLAKIGLFPKCFKPADFAAEQFMKNKSDMKSDLKSEPKNEPKNELKNDLKGEPRIKRQL